ncbi:uncharacterized protein LOC143043296 [Mytilus galloprovincialis]|uniref:uncharacterized protein LOC143043296 n=1 Tax=Mytilus galloprovincialis TaxID=29158 RepID=UPI003F7C4B98
MTPILTWVLFVWMYLARLGSIQGQGLSSSAAEEENEEVNAGLSVSLQPGITTVGVGNTVKYSKNITDRTSLAYEKEAGVFTVPANEAGTYSISVTMMSGYAPAHLTLMKGTDILVWLFTDKTFNMASQTINVALAENDQISVQMKSGSDLFDVYNTFSACRIA